MDDRLGGSRSGDVFRARDTQSGATVVYKLAAPASLPSTAVFERALRELKQLQRAQNSHLARVLDFGKDADGRLFIVSDFVDGQPLDRMIAANGPLPLDRAKKIIAQIGEALLEGQKVGVVHHDLSAKNVLVTSDDSVKLINFVVPATTGGTVLGVPEYLSPEQAEGKLVDQRSNTYSLGGIFMLLLTGQPPFPPGDAAATLQQVLQGEISPPSRRAEGLTPEIDRVVLKAMDKSPNRRPLTMRQFLTDVTGLVAMGAAPAGANAGVGFAKTMLFSGGSPEVQKLVNQAVAARAGGGNNATAGFAAAPTPAPAASAGDSSVTPPPVSGAPAVGARRTHGAAIAATVVSLPAAKLPGSAVSTAPGSAASPASRVDSGPIAATPPPVAFTPPPQQTPAASAGAPAPKPAAGGTFRETLWFKKGDVDQMVADARARVEAARAKGVAAPEPEVPVAPEEEAKPLDERYVDDGSVTAEDRKKFSLRSGATSTALPTVGSGAVVPGDRMSDSEMVGQIGGGKRTLIIVGAVAVALGVGVMVYMLMRSGKNVEKSVEAITPAPVATQPAPPPPAAEPPPPAPTPPAPKAPAPVATKDKDGDEPATAPKAAKSSSSSSSKKHVAAKKTKGKKPRK
jgi:serine/threonine-protein kinase